jgi:hypothetical protein
MLRSRGNNVGQQEGNNMLKKNTVGDLHDHDSIEQTQFEKKMMIACSRNKKVSIHNRSMLDSITMQNWSTCICPKLCACIVVQDDFVCSHAKRQMIKIHNAHDDCSLIRHEPAHELAKRVERGLVSPTTVKISETNCLREAQRRGAVASVKMAGKKSRKPKSTTDPKQPTHLFWSATKKLLCQVQLSVTEQPNYSIIIIIIVRWYFSFLW